MPVTLAVGLMREGACLIPQYIYSSQVIAATKEFKLLAANKGFLCHPRPRAAVGRYLKLLVKYCLVQPARHRYYSYNTSVFNCRKL